MLMFAWLLAIVIAAVVAPGVNRVFGSRGGWGLALVPAGVIACLLKFWPSVVGMHDVSASFDWVPALNLVVSLRLDGLSLLLPMSIPMVHSLWMMRSPCRSRPRGMMAQRCLMFSMRLVSP